MRPENDLPQIPLLQLFAPYLSLERGAHAPLNAFGPPIAFEWWIERKDFEAEVLLVQRIMPPAFRGMLADELKLPYVGGLDPLAVPAGSRSSRWNTMCTALSRFRDMPARERVAFLGMLMALGYYELVYELALLPTDTSDEAAPYEDALAYAAASARYIVSINDKTYSPVDLIAVAERARPGSRAHFLASSRLLMFYGRFRSDAENGRHWRHRNKESLDEVAVTTTDFTRSVLTSRYWRSASLIPLVEKNLDRASEEIGQAEHFARRARPVTEREALLARANLYPVLQSKARLAQLLGDHDLALKCIEEMCILDPYYCTAFVDLGHVYLAMGEQKLAYDAFQRGSRLGPPAAPIARFLTEQCERLA